MIPLPAHRDPQDACGPACGPEGRGSPLDRFGIDRFHEACGVAAVHGHGEAANLVYLALYALQHRGQESAGIVSGDGDRLHRHVGMGLVADVVSPKELARLPGDHAIGHVRYGTAGGSNLEKKNSMLSRG